MNILVIGDTQKQLDNYRKRNMPFIRNISVNTMHYISSYSLCIYFVLMKTIEAGTCGQHMDLVINLSKRKITDKIKQIILPCLH